MSMSRNALTEDTLVKGALKRALEIGIGLFVAGWISSGYLQTFRDGIAKECDGKLAALRVEMRETVARAVDAERDRNTLLYKRKDAPR